MIYRLLIVGFLHALVAGVSPPNTCTTPGCVSIANAIKNNVDETVDPCDDFHNFACGKWIQNNPIPPDHDKWDIFETLTEVTSKKLIDMLNDDSNPSSTTAAYEKARKMYKNCMDLEAIEKNGVGAIVSRLKSTGGWPMMMAREYWKPRVSVSKIHGYYVKELNLAPLFAIYEFPDSQNSSVNKLYIDATFFTPFKDILRTHERNSPEVVQYAEKITRVVNILANATGNAVKAADVQQDVTNLIDFEQTLAKLIPDPLAAADIQRRRNLMTVKDLQTWYNNKSKTDNSTIIWISLLASIFENTGINFTDESDVIFTEKHYAENIIKLLENTPLRTIVNYIQWDFINEVLVAAPKKLRSVSSELLQLKTGVKASRNRSATCTQLLRLHHAVGHQFVKRYLSSDTKNKANEIITEMVNATDELLQQTSWLNANEQQFVRDKLTTMIRSVGYPEWYDDPVNVDKYYEECVINDNFLDNIMEVRRCEKTMDLRRLMKPVNKTEFRMSTTKFNAGYDPALNAITFTSAVLQMPVFDSDYPSVLQHATFGTIAGHEISHAFDAIGAGFDKNGNHVNWWSNETKKTFMAKVDCFVKQYDNYIIYENENITIKARGDLSTVENIADLHGLKLAYAAYESTKTPEDTNLRLPGLESYNDKQLFFLTHATLWCSVANEAYYINKARNDWHSIPKLRAIGALSNMEEFSAAFNCPNTAQMNPQTKCVIWGANTIV